MKELGKRLVEVETILHKMSNDYRNKIPNSFWNFIKNYKDAGYSFDVDFLEKTNIHIDTICILTYINLHYFMNDKEKQTMNEILTIDSDYKFS